jgi:type VI secretion system protein VasD
MRRRTTRRFAVDGSALRALLVTGLYVVTTGLTGCATSGGSGAEPGLLDRALQAVGLSKPPLPELPAGELPTLNRKIAVRLHAGDFLNTDPAGKSLTLVTRVYQLKDRSAFMQASYDSLQPATPAKDAGFAPDIVEMREVVLGAGTRNEVVETLPPQAKYLGVVAFFRAPAEGRWRFVFEAKAAEASGITLGLHACAMSVAQGQPLDASAELQRLAGVTCGKKELP